MSESVLECVGSYSGLFEFEKKILKNSTFLHASAFSRLFTCLMVVVQKSLYQFDTRAIEQDAWSQKEKALRVPRAVNIG